MGQRGREGFYTLAVNGITSHDAVSAGSSPNAFLNAAYDPDKNSIPIR